MSLRDGDIITVIDMNGRACPTRVTAHPFGQKVWRVHGPAVLFGSVHTDDENVEWIRGARAVDDPEVLALEAAHALGRR